jgi:hypothetical protein
MMRNPIEEISDQISQIEWPHRNHQIETRFLFDLVTLPEPALGGIYILMVVRVLHPARRIVMFTFGHAKLILNEREIQLCGYLGYSWRYPLGTRGPNTSFLRSI